MGHSAEKLPHDPTEAAEQFQAMRKELIRYAIRCGVRRDACDDVLQEASISVFQKFCTFDEKRSFRNWIFAIVHNQVLDWNRRRNTQSRNYRLNEYGSTDRLISRVDDSAAKPLSSELKDCLDNLKPLVRNTFYQAFLEKKPQIEIAQEENLAPSAISMRLSRGRSQLKQCLEGKGYKI